MRLTVVMALGLACLASLGCNKEEPPPTITEPDAGTYDGPWEKAQPLPMPLRDVAAATVGDRIYVVGGFVNARELSDAVLIYDPGSDTWSEGPSLPEPRHQVTLAVVQEDLFVIGGRLPRNFEATNLVYVLRRGGSEWTELARMPEERAGASAVVIGEQIVVAGGQEIGGAPAPNVLIYSPTSDDWSFGREIITPRSHQAGFARNDQLFIAGGQGPSLAASDRVVEVYNPATDEWRDGPRLRKERSDAVATEIGEAVVLTGGRHADGSVAGVDVLVGGSWDEAPGPEIGRYAHAAAALEGVLYVIGGSADEQGNAIAEVESLDLSDMLSGDGDAG